MKKPFALEVFSAPFPIMNNNWTYKLWPQLSIVKLLKRGVLFTKVNALMITHCSFAAELIF